MTILNISLQFIMGFLIGVMMDDDNEGVVGANEFTLASIVFVIIGLFGVLAQTPEHAMSWFSFGILTIGWAILWGGVFVGNKVRTEFIKRIIGNCARVEIQLALTGFLRAAQNYGYHGDEEKFNMMNQRLAEVQEAFASTLVRFRKLNNKDIQDMENKLGTLAGLCYDYADFAQDIVEEKDQDRKNNLIKQWLFYGDNMIEHLRDTLLYTEVVIAKDLRKLSTIAIVRLDLI